MTHLLAKRGNKLSFTDKLTSNITKLVLSNVLKDKSDDRATEETNRNNTGIIDGLTTLSRIALDRFTVPSAPRSRDEQSAFHRASTSALSTAIEYFKRTVNTPITPITAVSTEKNSNTKAITEFERKYTTTAAQLSVATAKSHLDIYRDLLTEIETTEIRRMEEDLVSIPLGVSTTNLNSVMAKVERVQKEAAMLSVNSIIAHGTNATIIRPQFWQLQNSRYGLSFVTFRDAGQTTRAGDASVLDEYSDTMVVANAASVVTGTAQATPNGWTFMTVVRSGNTNGHVAFPPKESCYSWAATWNLRFSISGGNLSTLFSGTSGIIHIHTGLEGDPLSAAYEFPISWSVSATSYVSDIQVEVPFTSSKRGVVECFFSTGVAVAYTLNIQAKHSQVVGTPLSDTCSHPDIDYLTNSSTARQFLGPNTRWLQLFGRVVRDPWADPNFSIEALWNERSAFNTIMMGELLDSYKEYVSLYFGTGPGSASVDDKYISLGLNGISDMAKFTSYPYTNGPFAGKDWSTITMLLRYFTEDLEFMGKALLQDSNAAKTFIGHNLFTNDICAK